MTELVDSNFIPCDSIFAQFSGINDYDFLKITNRTSLVKQICIKNDRKEPTAGYSPSKAATSDNLSQEIVSRQVFISCLDKTMATDWSSIPLNLFLEAKLATVQTFL